MDAPSVARVSAARDTLWQLLSSRGFRRAVDKPFKLASGKESPFYFNGKEVLLTHAGMRAFADWALAQAAFADPRPTAVGGIELGAVPMACAIAMAAPFALDAFIVRKEAKGHGTARRIEGTLQAGDRVVVVEDVVTTGGSTRHGLELLEGLGVEVSGVLCLVDRDLDRGPGEDQLAAYRSIVMPVFRLSEVAELLP